MKAQQIATLLNGIAGEVAGDDAIFAEDLSNVVDAGKTFLNLFSNSNGLDNAIKAIVDKVGKTIIVDRNYTGGSPSIIRDSWEYGSILEKVRIKLPEASANNTWNLTSGTKYDDILVYDPPEASATYFNSKDTYNIKMSLATIQLKEAFKSAGALNRFIAGIENRIRTAMTFNNDNMAQRTLNNLILISRARRIKLVTMYNADHPTSPITNGDEALLSAEFLRYAAMQIALYSDYMTRLSANFNNGDFETFTPKAYQHFVVLSKFAKAVDVYSLSDTYHNDFVKLVKYETVPFWQGVRTIETDPDANPPTVANDYANAAIWRIQAKPTGENSSVTLDGVVGVLFDRDAAAICNENERVTSFFNAENETTKYYYKYDVSYQNDPNENCIVFTLE